jgi:hypothetical protein
MARKSSRDSWHRKPKLAQRGAKILMYESLGNKLAPLAASGRLSH